MAEKIINVLYVDDEPHNLRSFDATYRKVFNIHLAVSAKEAEKILDNVKNIHVLITDQRMPETLGTELLENIVKRYPKQTRIILTAYPEDENVREAERKQLIYRSVAKPWDADKLEELIIDGYDLFCSKQELNHAILKYNKAKKDFDKTINKNLDDITE